MREVLNAILYQTRTGCQWDMLPHDLPAQEHRLRLLRRSGGTTAPGSGSSTPCGRRSGSPRAASRRRGPPASTARRSRRPRSAASGATTGARRSAGGSGTSSSTRWGCCWRWSSRRPRPTTGRRPRGCSGSWTGRGSRRLEMVWADGKYHNHDLDALAGAERRPVRVEVVERPAGLEGVREAAEALGGGADLRLAGPVSAAQQGLRVVPRVERGVGPDQRDRRDAEEAGPRRETEASPLQVPEKQGSIAFRIASE